MSSYYELTNLLKETKEVLEFYKKTLDDIKWVGTREFYVDIEKFIELADTGYFAGYGAAKVAEDLIIVGEDFWLERCEYDGSEWWNYKRFPKKPKEKFNLKVLTVEQAEAQGLERYIGWSKLKELHGKKGDDND